MINPRPDVLHTNMVELARYRHEHLRGDEKGEAQVFLDRVFRAFGHQGVSEAGATLEDRIKNRDTKSTNFADLMWKPRCLIEMKKASADLSRHYRQAFDYWIQAVPDRPRYVVLCNFDEFWVYDFNLQLDEPMDKVSIDDLPQRAEALSFLYPREEKPIFGNDLVAVTRDAASRVARVFTSMHERGITREKAQRFVLQSVMAMFSEDIGLLPGHVFTRALEDSVDGSNAYDLLFGLFREMNTPGVTPGGRYQGVPYFNGGLFSNVEPFEIGKDELLNLQTACRTDWSAVRPEIFGTLFEQSMAEGERHAHGAHFTSQADIIRIVGPTITNPWREEIAKASRIEDLERLLGQLYSFRVLDPACGSGNFLYVAYRELRRIENEIHLQITQRRRGVGAEQQGQLALVSADHFYGIDINPFAVEIAKVTMMLAKKLSADELSDNQQVLPLDRLDDTIVTADALFSPWPKADAIIGNPPYLGRRKMVDELGGDYCQRLRERYPHVSGVSDFVTYWFPLAQDHLPDGGRAGLVATNTIRQNDSRTSSLDYVVDHGGVIFDAVSSQPWSGDAKVHVSLVSWIKNRNVNPKTLWLNNGQLKLELPEIPSSLSPSIDVRNAKPLAVNQNPPRCFQGQTPGITDDGYVIDWATRREIIKADPKSSQVIHPFLGGSELLHKGVIDRWIVDVPFEDAVEAESQVPGAMAYLRAHVLPKRKELLERELQRNADAASRNPKFRPETQHQAFMARWWQLWRRRAEMLEAIGKLDRYLATSRVGGVNREPVFSFIDPSVRPGDSLSVFSLADDYSFGILSSSIHRDWFDVRCSTLKSDRRYTPTTVWDSFPWPQAPNSSDVGRVAAIAGKILDVRQQYLDRSVSLAKQYDTLRVPGKSALRELHQDLDAAVRAAYGFDQGDIVTQLYALNQDVSNEPSTARAPGPHELPGAHVTQHRITSLTG